MSVKEISEKKLEQLKKLIRHEKSAREISSVHEAEIFADKIQEFLDEYGLSMSEIDIKEEEQLNVDQELINQCFKREWKRHLIRRIADLNSCKHIYDSPRMILVGLEQDRRITFELYSYFADLGEHLYGFAAKSEKEEWGELPPKFKGSFMWGYALTIANRLYKRHKQMLENIPQTSTSLIHIGNKLAKAEQFVDAHIPTKASRPSMNISSERGYKSGVRAGNSVALTDETLEEKGRRQIS